MTDKSRTMKLKYSVRFHGGTGVNGTKDFNVEKDGWIHEACIKILNQFVNDGFMTAISLEFIPNQRPSSLRSEQKAMGFISE